MCKHFTDGCGLPIIVFFLSLGYHLHVERFVSHSRGMEPLCGRWGDDVFKQFKTILKSVEKSLNLGKRIIVVYIWNKCLVACYGTQILRSSLWYPSVKMSLKARDVY